MEKYAIIVAGGSGQRMGHVKPKQFIEVAGKPIIWHTVNSFLTCYDDMRVVLVLPPSYMTSGQELFQKELTLGSLQTVKGGENRFQSVKNGLQLVPPSAMVFVHDGVRCLVSHDLIRRCYSEAMLLGNAVPAIAPPDSTRYINDEASSATLAKASSKVIDRSRVRLIQTPQTFPAGVLAEAFKQPYNDRFSDEATVVESAGYKVNLVEGDRSNIKVTYPDDLLIAEQLLRIRSNHPNS